MNDNKFPYDICTNLIRNLMVCVNIFDEHFMFIFACLNCNHSHHESAVSYHRKNMDLFLTLSISLSSAYFT